MVIKDQSFENSHDHLLLRRFYAYIYICDDIRFLFKITLQLLSFAIHSIVHMSDNYGKNFVAIRDYCIMKCNVYFRYNCI